MRADHQQESRGAGLNRIDPNQSPCIIRNRPLSQSTRWGKTYMRSRLLVLILLWWVPVAPTYAAGCGDITLCSKNPPYPPNPPSCITYPGYCSAVLPPVLTPTEAAGPSFSIQFDNLSKDQLGKVLDLLQIDKSKVQPPQ